MNERAQRVVEIMEANGHAVSKPARDELAAAMAESDAGSEMEQCCCALAVYILYLLRAPDGEEGSRSHKV